MFSRYQHSCVSVLRNWAKPRNLTYRFSVNVPVSVSKRDGNGEDTRKKIEAAKLFFRKSIGARPGKFKQTLLDCISLVYKSLVDKKSSKQAPLFVISRPVIVLGLVSLFTDLASEMLYPVMPIFLASVLGASMTMVGALEGLAEATAGLLKGFFGALSDRRGARKPFIVFGYTVSALSKPLPGILPCFPAVVLARISDRIGKAARTAPRDALLAAYAPPGAKGTIFGFHRAMDTIGAALGPSLALFYLWLHPGRYVELFIIAFLPSAVASLLTLLIKEANEQGSAALKTSAGAMSLLATSTQNMRLAFRLGGRDFRGLLLSFSIFSFLNSSDVFLIMRTRQLGFSDTKALACYILYNLVYAAAALPLGRLSDSWGKRKALAVGYAIFCLVYLGFAWGSSTLLIWLMFLLYGLHAAFTESIAKAWIAELAPSQLKGSAFGLFTMISSLGALCSSIAAGLLWEKAGPAAPFWAGAAGALTALLLLFLRNFDSR